jgi:predicted phosphodiesterase
MKIAIISDIHGNLESLAAISEPYDELWVLGDLVDHGPDPRCSIPYREMARGTMQYSRSVLSQEQLDYLTELPLRAERVINDTRFALCHAAPSDPLFKCVRAQSPEWNEEMKITSADVLSVGHMHTPFVQSIANRSWRIRGALDNPRLDRRRPVMRYGMVV